MKRLNGRLPIGPTLIVSLVLAALIPSLMAAWLLTRNSSQSIHTLAENAMSQAAHRVDVGALAHLGESHTVVNAIVPPFVATGAEADRTRNWLIDTPALETMAYALTQQSPNVPYLYVGAADGSFFGVEREDHGFVVREIRSGERGRRHYLIDQPGDRSRLVRVEESLYDPRKRPWYQLALSSGQRIFTDVYRSAVKDQFDLTLAQPIFSEDKRTVLGVVAVDMSLARLTDLIRASRISEHSVTYLVDSQGLMVASSVDEELSVQVNGKFQRLSPLQSEDPLVRESFTQVSAQYRDNIRHGPGVMLLERDADWKQMLGLGSNRLIALHRPFGHKYNLNWQLIVVAPESDFIHQVTDARQVALLALAGLIGLGAMLAYLVARGLSGQFALLNASATAVGTGQVPPVQRKTRLREVHLLSSVLHDSALSLRASTQEIHEKNEQLREAALMLEDRVRQRTAELAASREEALTAVKAKAGFLAVMSHEIRTPLNGVVGMSDLLRETPLNETQRDLLDVLKVSSEQLLAVVDDILDFSRIEAGKLTLEQRPFDLHAAIRQAHDMLQFRAQEKGLHMALHIAPQVPQAVVGDITRLRQVLINLLSNAIKFTHQGEITLRVWEEPDASGTVLSFSVSDTGMGIHPDRVGMLFQPFAQGDTAVTRIYGGTGLGLMICKHLVEMMGGQITVNSQPGAGSTFRFTIRAQAADPADIPIETTADLPRASAHQRVLVVDDNPVNLKVATAMLRRLGYNPDTAANGCQALSAVQQALQQSRPYAVVMLDSHMPELDGIATARAMRRAHGAATPALLGISASSMEEERQQCLEAGMTDYLPKPIDLERLAHVLHRLTTTPESAPAATDPHPTASLAPASNVPDMRWIDPGRWEAFSEFDDAEGNVRREVIHEFLLSLHQRVADIVQAAQGEDPTALRQATHVLKGAASNVGAEGLARLCEEMERKASHAERARALAPIIEQAAQFTEAELRAL